MQNLDDAKKIVDIAADVGVALEKLAADGGGLISKLSHLLPLSGDVVKLASVDFAKAKAEFSSLGEDDKKALLEEFKAKLQLDDAAVEKAIEGGLDIALELEGLIVKIVAFTKSLGGAKAAAVAGAVQ